MRTRKYRNDQRDCVSMDCGVRPTNHKPSDMIGSQIAIGRWPWSVAPTPSSSFNSLWKRIDQPCTIVRIKITALELNDWTLVCAVVRVTGFWKREYSWWRTLLVWFIHPWSDSHPFFVAVPADSNLEIRVRDYHHYSGGVGGRRRTWRKSTLTIVVAPLPTPIEGFALPIMTALAC